MYLTQLLTVGGEIPPSEFEYFHNGKSDFSTAYTISERGKTVFKIPRILGTKTMFADFFTEAGEYIKSFECRWKSMQSDSDVYHLDLPISDFGIGLYFYRPRIISGDGELFGKRIYNRLYFSDNNDISDMFQFMVSDFAYPPPHEIYGGIIYHVFVDRFRQGGQVDVPSHAKLIPGKWESIPEYPEYPGAPLKNNTFYGGTLYGIAEKLDYIASLGVNAIYLSPIFESVSNHKYDTANYMNVDRMFGGEEALKYLISECDKREIKIVLDGVFNHTGADSIYFNRYGRFESCGAYQSKNSEYYDWFYFQDHPSKYTCWWDIEILPRINPDNPKCRRYFTGADGVISKYRDMGVYGFRLDVADELSDDFISEIKSVLTSDAPSVLYGEVWEDASNKIAYDKRKKYYLGKELDGVMNYPLRKGIIDYLTESSTKALEYALTDVMANAPRRIRDAQMNLLGTHDTGRILTLLANTRYEGKTNEQLSTMKLCKSERAEAKQKLLAAYTILATLPGIPSIFYADEVGLEGYGDPFNRMPFPWGEEDVDILNHYKTVGSIRRNNSVYKNGDYKLYAITKNLLVFSRINSSDEYLTVYNNSDHDIKICISVKSKFIISGEYSREHILPAKSAEIIKTVKNAKATYV